MRAREKEREWERGRKEKKKERKCAFELIRASEFWHSRERENCKELRACVRVCVCEWCVYLHPAKACKRGSRRRERERELNGSSILKESNIKRIEILQGRGVGSPGAVVNVIFQKWIESERQEWGGREERASHAHRRLGINGSIEVRVCERACDKEEERGQECVYVREKRMRE